MATPYMKLTLPIPTDTLGPDWAMELNLAIEKIDEHDHSSDKGRKVRTAGLNIDETLTLNNNLLVAIGGSQYLNRPAQLSGPAHVNSVFVFEGELYFTNGSGIPIRLTSGGAITPTPTTMETIRIDSINADVVLNNLSPFVLLNVNTTAPRQITLPLAATVPAGRIFLIKDANGLSDVNNITILPTNLDTIDGNTSHVVKSKRETIWVISDGISRWNII